MMGGIGRDLPVHPQRAFGPTRATKGKCASLGAPGGFAPAALATPAEGRRSREEEGLNLEGSGWAHFAL
jgi:hypothetical protein